MSLTPGTHHNPTFGDEPAFRDDETGRVYPFVRPETRDRGMALYAAGEASPHLMPGRGDFTPDAPAS